MKLSDAYVYRLVPLVAQHPYYELVPNKRVAWHPGFDDATGRWGDYVAGRVYGSEFVRAAEATRTDDDDIWVDGLPLRGRWRRAGIRIYLLNHQHRSEP